MRLEEASRKLWELQLHEHIVAYTGRDGTKITAIRTDKICPHDFGVGLAIPGRAEFRPTHVRLLFDLYLKRLSNAKDAKVMFGAIDLVYQGEDPSKITEKVEQLNFAMQLDQPDTTLYYMQLLMIEQEFNYGPQGCKEGKVQPPREFLMRFIRWVASDESQIDDIISTAVRNRPPRVRYAKWDDAWITRI
jgi:hypothetical protein